MKLKGNETFNGLKRIAAALPAGWYHDPAQYATELENIFYRNWLYLCHASTFRNIGDFRQFTIGNRRVLLVRSAADTVSGYYNACRHRGALLCRERAGRLSGRLIVCPYHQWSYALDGTLVATSSQAEPAGFDRSGFSLLPVRVRVWRGGVFVSLAKDPPDISESFARGGDRISNWPMESLVVGHLWTKTVRCNWKLFWENFNECLHCPNIHPELCDLVPIYGRRITQARDAVDWQDHRHDPSPEYSGGLRPGADTWSMDGRALEHRFSGLDDEETKRGQSYFVSLPSVYIAAHVDYMRTVRVSPLGPEQTELEVEWLFSPQALADNPDLDNITSFAKRVITQDADASELNQAGIRSLGDTAGVLMPEEHYVKDFQDWIRMQCDG